MPTRIIATACFVAVPCLAMSGLDYSVPMNVGEYDQEAHRPYTTEQGLPSNEVNLVAVDAKGFIRG